MGQDQDTQDFVHGVFDASYRRLVVQVFAVCGDRQEAEGDTDGHWAVLGSAPTLTGLAGNGDVLAGPTVSEEDGVGITGIARSTDGGDTWTLFTAE